MPTGESNKRKLSYLSHSPGGWSALTRHKTGGLNYKEKCHKYCKKVGKVGSHVTKKNIHQMGEFE